MRGEAVQGGLRWGRQGRVVVTVHQALQTTARSLAFISRATGRCWGALSGGVVWSDLCFRRAGCSGGVGPGRPRGSSAAMGKMQRAVRMWVDWRGRTVVAEESPFGATQCGLGQLGRVMVTLGGAAKTRREGGAGREWRLQSERPLWPLSGSIEKAGGT